MVAAEELVALTPPGVSGGEFVSGEDATYDNLLPSVGEAGAAGRHPIAVSLAHSCLALLLSLLRLAETSSTRPRSVAPQGKLSRSRSNALQHRSISSSFQFALFREAVPRIDDWRERCESAVVTETPLSRRLSDAVESLARLLIRRRAGLSGAVYPLLVLALGGWRDERSVWMAIEFCHFLMAALTAGALLAEGALML